MTLPPWDGERDRTDPFAYPPRHRTPEPETARPSGTPPMIARRRARIAALVTVVLAGVLAFVAWAGVTIAREFQSINAEPFVTGGPGPARPAAPVVTPSPHDITAVLIPDGWARRASPGSGALAFAYDPSWTDVVDSPEDRQFQEEADAAAGDNPQDAVLLLGHWQRAASATMPAVAIRVVEDPLAGSDEDLRTIVERYANERAAVEGDESPSLVYSGDYAHPLFYEGWRVTTWADVDGERLAIDVTGIRYQDTVVFASMTANGYPVPIDALPSSVVFLPDN